MATPSCQPGRRTTLWSTVLLPPSRTSRLDAEASHIRGFVSPSVAPYTVPQGFSRPEVASADPLPVLLLRHGPVPIREFAALHTDQRLELFVADQLTPAWTSFAERVAGTIVVSDGDPMSALLYAVTGGIKGVIVLMVPPRYKSDCQDFIAAGAAACVGTPVTREDLDRIVPLFASHASLSRIDKTSGLLLDPITHTVRLHDSCMRLTQREFAVLQCLSSYQGRPVAAHKLVAYVWGERAATDGSRNILDVYVCQLRRKLERLGLKGAISTVRGLGYALVRVPANQPTVS